MISRSVWGQAKKEFGKVQDEKIKKEMVKDFVDFYGKNIVNESTLIRGVKDFLIWCKEKKISMAALPRQRSRSPVGCNPTGFASARVALIGEPGGAYSAALCCRSGADGDGGCTFADAGGPDRRQRD